ncbi:bisanhydrobacterioruberin hydratase CruF [Salinibacter altiplanensis]|uniref:bisanhydrobacterioruberin hydratase CruF n=1 Tax=Salinibacter altiplanensis TaxID=1803181 RepID=UPI000C9EF577|nr:bisanhydrobacterioruberin hydratase CruF [Salinibacter altiplanensis]
MSTSDPSPPTLEGNYDLLFRFAFWLFVGAISFSVAGMLLLRLVPSSMAFFGPIYTKLVKTPTWTFMTLLALLPLLMYGPALGWKRMSLIAAWGCLVGGASELIGTTGWLTVGSTPLPFGEYQYTQWLGPKIAGHVPYFIPPSWFAMSIVSLDLARRVTTQRVGALLLGTLFMVLWDVSLDPAMNQAFPFWEYGVDGAFFGMPLSNWAGWAGVTFVILLGYEYIGEGVSIQSEWGPWVYALNCIFPLSICLLRDVYLPALIGGLAAAVPFLLLWRYNPVSLKRSVSLLRR